MYSPLYFGGLILSYRYLLPGKISVNSNGPRESIPFGRLKINSANVKWKHFTYIELKRWSTPLLNPMQMPVCP